MGIFFLYEGPQFFNSDPIYNYDYPYHLYNCYEAQHFYAEGKSWGYSPFFKAGYPSSLKLDNELLQLICFIFSFQNQIILIKVWTTLILLLLPILIYYSSLNFGFNKRTAIISMIILLVYLYNDYFINSLIYFGLFNFIFGSILSLLYLSLFYRYIIKKERKVMILLLISFPLTIPLIHASTLLIFFIPFFLLYFINIKKLPLKNNLIITTIIAISLLIYISWIGLPFLVEKMPYVEKTNKLFQINNVKEVITDFYYSSKFHNRGEQYIKTSIILLGFLGMFRWLKKNRLFYVFLPTSILLFVMIYFHNIIKIINFISSLQPYKYIVPLIFFLIIPSSDFIIKISKKILSDKSCTFVKVISVFIIASIVLQIVNVHAFDKRSRLLFTEPPSDYLDLTKWVKENTNNKGRILFERELQATDLFNKPSHLYALFSFETNREILGGPHMFAVLKHDFPSMTRYEIFEKGWNISDEELMDYLNLYNVGWIIARSKQTKEYLYERYKQNSSLFKSMNIIIPEYYEGNKYHRFHIYEVNRNLSFIIGGTGDVIADFNKIKIKNLKTEDKDIILKYHWHPTLKARPEFELRPVYISDAPVPFIKVLGVNTTEFEIYNSYK